jgi:predicted ATPase
LSFLTSLSLRGLLSFPPDSEPIVLTPLNVLIGPNGSGKSNLIEGLELLKAAPAAFAGAIRDGGGVLEWLWKGNEPAARSRYAEIEAVTAYPQGRCPLRYRLKFAASGQRTEVIDEAVENSEPSKWGAGDVYFYYRYHSGHPVINVNGQNRYLKRETLQTDESVLSQRKDPEQYPEISWLGSQFARIQTFREWTFGRYSQLRQPQPPDLDGAALLPDARNLGLVLNSIDNSGESHRFNQLLHKFLPRFERFTVKLEGGTVQLNLHEAGLASPVPATRLSDGTIRFVALLALLLSPSPPPLACIEEPELGLHPDALSLLAKLFVEASSHTQLVITTHSEALVSALSDESESVLVCENENGTVLRRLEAKKLQFWLEKYRLGELWRMGELAGNP